MSSNNAPACLSYPAMRAGPGHELADDAEFLNGSSFRLLACPFSGDIPLGLYELPRRSGEAHYYRLAHPLAEHVLETARSRQLSATELVFDYSSHPSNIAIVEQLVGKSGVLGLTNRPCRNSTRKRLTSERLPSCSRHFASSNSPIRAFDRARLSLCDHPALESFTTSSSQRRRGTESVIARDVYRVPCSA